MRALRVLVVGLLVATLGVNAAAAPGVGAEWVPVTASAAFSPRDTASGAVHDGKLWLSNGYYHGNVLIRDLWASVDGATWELVLGETPYDGYSEIASFQGRLWAVKGSVWSSADGRAWEQVLAETPFGTRSYGNLLVHDGKMWQLGSGQDVWCTADGVNWTCVADDAPFGARTHMEVVFFQDRFWLLGGRADGANDPPEKGYPQYSTFNDVWTFSPVDHTWERIAEHAPWSRRMWSAAAVFEGKIWLTGGYDNVHHTNLADVWYTENGKDWSEFSTTKSWTARHEPTLYVFQDRQWLVAGNTWPVVNDVWRLEISREAP
jgi:hypothetical protein